MITQRSPKGLVPDGSPVPGCRTARAGHPGTTKPAQTPGSLRCSTTRRPDPALGQYGVRGSRGVAEQGPPPDYLARREQFDAERCGLFLWLRAPMPDGRQQPRKPAASHGDIGVRPRRGVVVGPGGRDCPRLAPCGRSRRVHRTGHPARRAAQWVGVVDRRLQLQQLEGLVTLGQGCRSGHAQQVVARARSRTVPRACRIGPNPGKKNLAVREGLGPAGGRFGC